MTGFLLRRLAATIAVLFGVSVGVFAIMHAVPGDPVRLALGTRFDPQTYATLRHQSGLDRPLLSQYVRWLGGLLHGDLGVSFRSEEPVSEVIGTRLPATVSLAVAAIVIAIGISVPLGLAAASRPHSAVDRLVTLLSQVGISVPDFWLGIIAILLLAGNLGWFPAGGYVPLSHDPTRWARHLILPAACVGVVSGAVLTRFVRAAALEALHADHVRAARAKGVPERAILRHHVLRNAAVPVLTVGGIQLAYLLSGVVVVEIVFSWNGLGRLAMQSVQSRDYPVLQGAVLLFALVFLVINLIVDVLTAAVDPRIALR
ncbi:MAG TPA: ABC transporter permease [Sporichthyaceae bacterium]